jgi:transposase
MLLTMREKTRIEAVRAVMDGRLSVAEAAHVLNLSERQVYRALAAAREQGLDGLVHGNRGRAPWNKSDEALWARVLRLARDRYADINDQHLCELLEREHSIRLHPEALRRHLRAAGIAPKRKRRARKFRQRRERRAAAGMLLQVDASRHDWLEGRGPHLTLVGAKDDATGEVWAQFGEAESCWAYLSLMRTICLSTGVPLALYSDRHTIFHSPREPTVIEQLANQRPLTQFGRAMEELGVSTIKAYSPQAKGRSERQWGVFQARLVVELRLAGAHTLREANRVLAGFLPGYNRRFTVPPREQAAVWRKSPPAHQLDRILCLKEQRVVGRDHVVSFDGLALQLASERKYYSLARQRVEVLQLRDGSVEVHHERRMVTRFTAPVIARLIRKSATVKKQVRSQPQLLT